MLGKTPTFNDIEQLALDEPILHRCYTLLRRGDITLEQSYILCIMLYVEENQKLREKLLQWFQESPVSFCPRDDL